MGCEVRRPLRQWASSGPAKPVLDSSILSGLRGDPLGREREWQALAVVRRHLPIVGKLLSGDPRYLIATLHNSPNHQAVNLWGALAQHQGRVNQKSTPNRIACTVEHMTWGSRCNRTPTQ